MPEDGNMWVTVGFSADHFSGRTHLWGVFTSLVPRDAAQLRSQTRARSATKAFFCDRVKLLNHQRRSKQNRYLCCEGNFLSASVAHSAHTQHDAVTG